VEVLEPSVGTVYGDQQDIVFRWTPTSSAVIVYVLDAVPNEWSKLADDVIWGFAAPPSSVSAASWSMGETVTNGHWTAGAPVAPVNIPLYFVIEEVSGGNLVGLSALVPFVVGPWPDVGSPCNENDAVPDECNNPSLPPQLCQNGLCRRLCASNADCMAGTTCADTVWVASIGGSIRYCQ
jgi:hypothetical protein